MVRNVREDILIWDSCGCLNNTYRSLSAKLSLICSHNCLRSIQKTAVRKSDLQVKRLFVWSFSHRKALWPCLHLVWSSLESESSAFLVFCFTFCAVLVSKPDSSWRKQNRRLPLGYAKKQSGLKDHKQWLVLGMALNLMCDGTGSPVWDWICSEENPSDLHTMWMGWQQTLLYCTYSVQWHRCHVV